jgi:cytochrome oxidase Cu insertion factor (SCO1/SenC/PrrC family)
MHRVTDILLALALALSLPAWSAERAANTVRVAAGDATAADADEASRAYFTDLELVTQNGEDVRFFSDVLKDKIVLINFIFTHCQDACPMMTQKLKSSRALLDEQIRNRVHFISISIDPERDTPAAMKEFASRYDLADDSNWVFLTGAPENVNTIVKKLGQYTSEVENHSTLVLAGNVNDHYWMKIPPMDPPGIIAERLRLLAQGQ